MSMHRTKLYLSKGLDKFIMGLTVDQLHLSSDFSLKVRTFGRSSWLLTMVDPADKGTHVYEVRLIKKE